MQTYTPPKIVGKKLIYAELPILEGLKLSLKPKKECVIPSIGRVSPASGRLLFNNLIGAGAPIRCYNCGVVANCWVVDKSRSETAPPYPQLNLFAKVSEQHYVLMTQDHIIPKSKGGSNSLDNLRPACAPCNNSRKSEMTAEELQFMQNNPKLYTPT